MLLRRIAKKSFNNFHYNLVKKGVTSGGSRLSFRFKRFLPLDVKVNRHRYNLHSQTRSLLGRRTLHTRKSFLIKRVGYNVNYSFRLRILTFTASIIILPYSHKLISLMFLSNGGSTYLPTTHSHTLFCLSKMYKMTVNTTKLKSKLNLMSSKFFIKPDFSLVKMLPRNKPISLLEPLPGTGIKYVRSPGSSASITKMDFRTSTALVKLPSGVRKVFSVFSLGSLGQNPLSNNRYWRSNKAGYYSKFGRKPNVRGVAMNPVDHPHGGRTKAIRYPRTPWGKTTKFK